MNRYSIFDNRKSRYVLVVCAVLVVVLVLAGGGFWAYKNKQKGTEPDNVQIKRLVGLHVILPEGEEPVLATITDKNKLESEFLKRGQDGDRVLIYSKAKKVIIYRPSIDRVVEIGPVSIIPLNEGEKNSSK